MNESMYVDQFYEMDPEFEDVIMGGELRDGMIVLLEDGFMRGDPDKAFRSSANDDHARYEVDRCKESARWCEVTRLQVVQRAGMEPLLRFIAVYPDGTKRLRTYSSAFAWYVKRETLQPAAVATEASEGPS